jgi:hypothetical protein
MAQPLTKPVTRVDNVFDDRNLVCSSAGAAHWD